MRQVGRGRQESSWPAMGWRRAGAGIMSAWPVMRGAPHDRGRLYLACPDRALGRSPAGGGGLGESDPLVSVKVAAQALFLCDETVLRWLRPGALPHVNLRGRVVISTTS